MPFKSKAQQRYIFAAEARGELKPGTAREWARKTKNFKKLPEHVSEKKSTEIKKDVTSDEARALGNKLGVRWDDVDLEQLRQGIMVEREHFNVTEDPLKIAKIALAHLAEKKDYYTRLAKMEKEACYFKNASVQGVWAALDKYAAFTPALLKDIAREEEKDLDQEVFKDSCKCLTGEVCLDKMDSKQLGKVAAMLWFNV